MRQERSAQDVGHERFRARAAATATGTESLYGKTKEPPWTWSERGSLRVLRWPAFDEGPAEAIFTSRLGGISTGPYDSLNLALHVGDDPASVIENRRRAAGALGAALEDLVFAEQVHGARTALVGAEHKGRGTGSVEDAIAGTDALVTREPGVVLAIMVADCAPIVLADPALGILACVHAGWRGLVNGVIEAAVTAMVGLGSTPSAITAAIGPTVPMARYEVGQEVVSATRRALGDDMAAGTMDLCGHGSDRDPKWHLDLRAAASHLLCRAGVPADRIGVAPWSTGSPGAFYSARDGEPCGRFALLARLRP